MSASGSHLASGGARAASLPRALVGSRALAFAAIVAELALLVLVAIRLDLEGTAFRALLPALVVAFVLHHALPLRLRLPLFVGLSFAVTGYVLGIEQGRFVPATALLRTALLAAVGGGLIALCHLRVAFAARVGLLLAAGAGLAAARLAFPGGSVFGTLWPVFGAMFMFRLAVYLYDVEHEKTPPAKSLSLAYFFMLPNALFTLFPVVDFKSFARGHYAADALLIYQRGVQWMARGVLQLLLYRLVYYHVHLDPSRVEDGADLVRFLVANVAMYLKVSGTFHLIVGVLHLFGFALPQTNRRYFLASSFNDYWRRVNIYWKDFIMKVVYYPTFFRMKTWKGLGPTAQLALATGFAFAVSWLLHSYQLFWLRGDFPIKAQDALFWGALGALVVANSLWEMRRGRARTLGKRAQTAGARLGLALRTAGTFAVLTTLWSLWNAPTLEEWLLLWSKADWLALGWGLAVLGAVAVAAVFFGGEAGTEPALRTRPGRAAAAAPAFPWRDAALRCALPVLAVLLLTSGAVASRVDEQTRVVLASLSWTRPNTADDERMLIGYYEDVMEPSRFNPELDAALGGRPAGWVALLEDTEAARESDDFTLLELVPSRTTVVNGTPIGANQWGLRDRDYALAKPEGTVRIVLLGSSHEMGWGVGDGETFEAIAEDRLAAEVTPRTGRAVEILNFSVNSHGLIELRGVLEKRAAAFDPDVVVLSAHSADRMFVVRRFAKMLRRGTPPPYEFLTALAQRADVDAKTPDSWAYRRLTPHADEMIAWAYQSIADEVRRLGATPVWLWVPSPKSAEGDASDEPAMRALAERAGFRIESLTGAYGAADPATLVLGPWDGHPNAAGHRLLADAFTRVLTELPEIGLESPVRMAEPQGGLRP